MVRNESPDLVMLDMMMPKMDGIEVCRAVRSFSEVPILAYSAIYEPDEIINAKIAGVNDYLQKPSPIANTIEHINKE